MKKLILFNACALCLFFIFQMLLFFDKLGSAGVWISAHEVYLGGFVGLNLVFLISFSYFKYKREKAKQSPAAWAAGNSVLKARLKSSKKYFGWTSGSLIVFLGCTQMVMFSHFTQNTSLLLTSGLTILYIVSVTIASWISVRNRKFDLEGAKQYRENISLKLKSIRSQLNPHFMFNALTSIQNLMNKNEIAAVNHYLTLFADLTRRVLDTSHHELISLADELQIQENYLQMEQLRFGFKYDVEVDESIPIMDANIPAMMLQPFVENAVKHGVAALHQDGIVHLAINKKGDELELSVTDNGNGFDKTSLEGRAGSFGLKLSEERIGLLNQLRPDQPINLSINSTPTGTHVNITFSRLFPSSSAKSGSL